MNSDCKIFMTIRESGVLRDLFCQWIMDNRLCKPLNRWKLLQLWIRQEKDQFFLCFIFTFLQDTTHLVLPKLARGTHGMIHKE